MNFTPNHLVKPSPWPLFISFGVYLLALSFTAWMHNYLFSGYALIYAFLFVCIIFSVWCRDIVREFLYLGVHTLKSKQGINSGFNLFVISEAFFFAGFIYAYFYSALAPTIYLGATWPPVGIEALDPWGIPFLNTVILLTSGSTGTYAHNALLANRRNDALLGLMLTIVLAWTFTGLQIYEYFESPFTLADSVYGGVFFSTVSLHGAHVVVGTIYIMVSYYRLSKYHFSGSSHINLETALLYWHFVDGIWLFVFTFYYIWAA